MNLGKEYVCIPCTILILATFLVWNYVTRKTKKGFCGVLFLVFVLFWSKTLFSNKFSRNHNSCHLLWYYVTCWALGASLVAQAVKNAWNAGNPDSIHGWGRSPGEGNSNPLQYCQLKKYHRRRSLAGYSPWDYKSWTQFSD